MNQPMHSGAAMPGMKHRGIWVLRAGSVAAVGMVAAALLVGCERRAAEARAPQGSVRPPAPVTVAAATTADVPVEVRNIGTVEAYRTVTVKSRVSGQIDRIGFDEGQHVEAGEVLFEIDARPFRASLAAAEGSLERDIATARNARQEAEFQRGIFERNAGTRREYDRAVAAAEAAEAQVKADEAAVENAKIQLDYTTIRSPLTGRAGEHLVDAGTLVKADDTALVTINQIEPIYVDFAVPEQHLADIQAILAAGGTIEVQAAPAGRETDPETGLLTFVDNRVDPATGTIRLKARFANAERRLWPGQSVNVVMTLTQLAGAVVVPSQAVQTGQQGSFVFVVGPDLTVESRPVTLGPAWSGLTVIGSGLAAGETVVTDGQLRLTPGAKVSIRDAADGAPASAPAGGIADESAGREDVAS